MATPNVEMQSDEEMLVEFVTDKGGSKLKLQVVDGRYYPTFAAEVIRKLGSLKIRDDDVILAGYLKAGTHWVWEILRMLLAGKTEIPDEEKDQGMIEQISQGLLDAMPSPRVLNTHVHFEQLPTEVMTLHPKIVYLTRNPKDTAVSMYHHHRKLWDYYSYDGTFENYLPLWVDGKVDYGSWFDHIENWSNSVHKYPYDKFLDVSYEELSKNPDDQIKRLASFLEVSPPDDLISKIRAECSFDSMRDKKGKFDLDAKGNPIMYRKGQVGDWKNHFSVSQNDWFDEIYKTKMSDIVTPFHWKFELK